MHRDGRSFVGFIRWMLLTVLLVVSPSYGWERDDRLAIMAADLLPAILGAQTGFDEYYFLNSKTPDSKRREITVHVLYRKKKYLADRVVKRINEMEPINGARLNASSVKVADFIETAFQSKPVDQQQKHLAQPIMIIEDLGDDLDAVLDISYKNNTLTYSSSMEDVEEGAAVGISVTERVLPVVNTTVTSNMKIGFSTLFMRIAKKVE